MTLYLRRPQICGLSVHPHQEHFDAEGRIAAQENVSVVQCLRNKLLALVCEAERDQAIVVNKANRRREVRHVRLGDASCGPLGVRWAAMPTMAVQVAGISHRHA